MFRLFPLHATLDIVHALVAYECKLAYCVAIACVICNNRRGESWKELPAIAENDAETHETVKLSAVKPKQ